MKQFTPETVEYCKQAGIREARQMFAEDREEARKAYQSWKGGLARMPEGMDRLTAEAAVEEWGKLFGETK